LLILRDSLIETGGSILDNNQSNKRPGWLPLLIFGVMLTTIGISLTLSSPAGYVFLIVGIALLLSAVLSAISGSRQT
jgi:hypothetical protein